MASSRFRCRHGQPVNIDLFSFDVMNINVQSLFPCIEYSMLAKAATPQVEYSADGDNWTVVTTGLKDTTVKFKVGVEQDDETTDGRKVKTVYHLEGPTKLVQKEKWDGKEATLVREVHGDELKVVT